MGLELGGLTRAAAIDHLREALTGFEAQAVTFRWRDRQWVASAADLGVTVNYEETVNVALGHGRAGSVLNRYATLIDRTGQGPVIVPSVAIDESVLTNYLAMIGQDIVREPRDAALRLEEGEVIVDPDQAGASLDVDQAVVDTRAAIRSLAPSTVDLRERSVTASTTARHLEAARIEGERLLRDDVTIVNGEMAWTVTVDELAQRLVLPPLGSQDAARIDPSTLVGMLAPIATEVDHAPHNATLAWDDGLYVLVEGTDGVSVDLDRLAAEVAAAAGTDERTVTLPVISIAPEIDGSNLDVLGISTLIAEGESSFAGSSPARATNVSVAAYFVSLTLVPPWGTFSFNDAIGPITVDKGYVDGKIISGDWIASDLGGGVCQVSTTVFRAALRAGFPFTEWHPHSFRLGFYELNGWPPGMDAAIYQPETSDEWELDLQFTNTTDAWMLLQMRLDGDMVTAEIYGGPTGYDVTISEPVLSDPISPPGPIERASAELAAGEREHAQVAAPGVHATVVRSVVRDGEVVSEDVFFSPYVPQSDVFLVGTAE